MKLHWLNWRQTLLWKIFNSYFQKVSQTIFIPIKRDFPRANICWKLFNCTLQIVCCIRIQFRYFLFLFFISYSSIQFKATLKKPWNLRDCVKISVWWSFSNVQLKVMKVLKPLWFTFSSTFNQFLRECVCVCTVEWQNRTYIDVDGVGKNKHKQLGLKLTVRAFLTFFPLPYTQTQFRLHCIRRIFKKF